MGHGRVNGSNVARGRFGWGKVAAVIALLAPLGAPHANPLGPDVVHGTAGFDRTGGVLTVTNTPSAIINWRSFSIAPGEVTRFVQQGAESAVLNRVVGVEPSSLLGQLSSNGRVFLINPNGIAVGESGRIDTAGFVASTLAMTDEDFLAGRLHFGGGDTTLSNRGVIAARDGSVVLAAPMVDNQGEIRVRDGEVLLAAGSHVLIGDLSQPDIAFEIEVPDGEVLNLGSISASGGSVAVFGRHLINEGEVSADAVAVGSDGEVRLFAQDRVELRQGSTVRAPFVEIDGADGLASVDGVIDASRPSGGHIEVNAGEVEVGGLLDASGNGHGGVIHLGGAPRRNDAAARVHVTAAGRLDADAGSTGDGGEILLWSTEETVVGGVLSARGGADGGDGGFIETSSAGALTLTARPDASAPNGRAGRWLIDPPGDLDIVSTPSQNVSATSPFAPAGAAPVFELDAGLLVSALNAGTSVEVSTDGAATASNLNLFAALAVAPSVPVTLTLSSAAGQVNILNDVTNTGQGTLTLSLQGGAGNRLNDLGIARPRSDPNADGRVALMGVMLTLQNGEIAGPVDLDGSRLDLTGNNLWTAIDASMNLTNSVIDNAGTFTFQGIGAISDLGGSSIVNRAGAVISAPGVDVTLSAPLSNQGTVESSGAATLTLSGTTLDGGVFAARDPASTIVLPSTATWSGGSGVGAGRFTGGSLSVPNGGNVAIDALLDVPLGITVAGSASFASDLTTDFVLVQGAGATASFGGATSTTGIGGIDVLLGAQATFTGPVNTDQIDVEDGGDATFVAAVTTTGIDGIEVQRGSNAVFMADVNSAKFLAEDAGSTARIDGALTTTSTAAIDVLFGAQATFTGPVNTDQIDVEDGGDATFVAAVTTTGIDGIEVQRGANADFMGDVDTFDIDVETGSTAAFAGDVRSEDGIQVNGNGSFASFAGALDVGFGGTAVNADGTEVFAGASAVFEGPLTSFDVDVFTGGVATFNGPVTTTDADGIEIDAGTATFAAAVDTFDIDIFNVSTVTFMDDVVADDGIEIDNVGTSVTFAGSVGAGIRGVGTVLPEPTGLEVELGSDAVFMGPVDAYDVDVTFGSTAEFQDTVSSLTSMEIQEPGTQATFMAAVDVAGQPELDGGVTGIVIDRAMAVFDAAVTTNEVMLLTAGELGGSGAITTGTLRLNDGVLRGSGTITATQFDVCTACTGAATVDGFMVDVGGGNVAGDLQFAGGAVLRNSGMLTIAGARTIGAGTGGGSIETLAGGETTLSGGAQLFEVPFTTAAGARLLLADVDATLAADASLSGTLAFDAGVGASTLGTGAGLALSDLSVSGAGTFNLASGTNVDIAGDVQLAGPDLLGADLTFAGGGTLRLAAGTLSANGSTRFDASLALEGGQLVLGGPLTTASRIDVSNGQFSVPAASIFGGALVAGTGATIVFEGTTTLGEGSSLLGQGTFSMAQGELVIAPATRVEIGAAGLDLDRIRVDSGTAAFRAANLNAQALTIGPGSGVAIESGSTSIAGPVVVDGRLTAGGGAFDAASIAVGPGGLLDGSGTLLADVVNDGTVSPGSSPGVLTLGSFDQTANGNLIIDVVGAGQVPGSDVDLLNVLGDVNLAGTLTVVTQNFGLAFPDSVTPVQFTGTSTGNFEQLVNATNTGAFAVRVDPQVVRLFVAGTANRILGPNDPFPTRGDIADFFRALSGGASIDSIDPLQDVTRELDRMDDVLEACFGNFSDFGFEFGDNHGVGCRAR